MAGAFQGNAFQNNAFQVSAAVINRTVTSTAVLPNPVNCVMAGNQPLEQGNKTIEFFNPNQRTKRRMSGDSVRRLSVDDPTFTVTTSKRGYK